jgi:hypothetical protein
MTKKQNDQKRKKQRDKQRKERREQANSQVDLQVENIPQTKGGVIWWIWNALKVCFGVMWKLFAVFAVVATLVAAIVDVFSLYPRLSLQTSTMRDPSNPASISITIKNESAVSIYEVSYACVQNKGESAADNQYHSNVVTRKEARIDELVAGDSATIWCDDMIRMGVGGPSPVVTTDFMVHLSFRLSLLPSFIPYRSVRDFRFVAEKNQEGGFTVFPQPQVPLPTLPPMPPRNIS